MRHACTLEEVRLRSFLPWCAALALTSTSASAQAEDTFAGVRAKVVAGQLAEAHEELLAIAKSATDTNARAAAYELLFVVDSWKDGGGVPPVRAARPAPPNPAGWEPTFVDARTQLLRGEDSAAAERLRALASAPENAVRGAVASELAHLAADLAARAPGFATPSAPTNGAAPAAVVPAPAPPAPAPTLAPPQKEGATESRWYGWQPLALDATGVTVLAVSQGKTAPVVLGIGILWLGPPIVHAAHGRFGTAGLDFAMRFLGPPLVALIGFGACGNNDPLTCAGVGVVAGGVAAAAVVVLDAALLSWEDVPKETTSHALRVLPTASIRREGGVDLGLHLSF